MLVKCEACVKISTESFRLFIGEKRTQTSEDLKACRHGREFLIPCTHYRDPYFDLIHLLTCN